MIRLSRMADYAVVLMNHMAHGGRAAHNAAEIAAEAHLPAPTVSKLLKRLAKAGLLQSTRGAHGGYTLGGAPHAISIAAIISAVDGPIALTDCLEGGAGDCEIEAICPVRHNWQAINEAVRGALERVTLAALAPPHLIFAERAAVPAASPPEARPS